MLCEMIWSNSLTQVLLCEQCIEWARKENRIYLRQSLEVVSNLYQCNTLPLSFLCLKARLIAVHVEKESYTESLVLGMTFVVLTQRFIWCCG